MKRKILAVVVLVCMLCEIGIASAQAEPFADFYMYEKSKKFKKFDKNVSQIVAGYDFIVYKKGKRAYAIGSDTLLGLKDIPWDSVNIKPHLIACGIKKVYATRSAACYTKGSYAYYWGYRGTELYPYMKDFVGRPKKYPKKLKKFWLSQGAVVFGQKNNLYVNRGTVTEKDGKFITSKPSLFLKGKLNKVKTVVIGERNVIVRYKNGKDYIMGSNQFKCIRANDTLFYKNLVPLTQFGKGVKKYVLSGSNIGAIMKNGDFYIAGSNYNGFLGRTASEESTYTPKLMMKNVKDVAMNNGYHILALKKNATVWAWGRNFSNPISKKSSKKIYTKPIKIASKVKAIATGTEFSVIIKKNGNAYWKGFLDGEI